MPSSPNRENRPGNRPQRGTADDRARGRRRRPGQRIDRRVDLRARHYTCRPRNAGPCRRARRAGPSRAARASPCRRPPRTPPPTRSRCAPPSERIRPRPPPARSRRAGCRAAAARPRRSARRSPIRVPQPASRRSRRRARRAPARRAASASAGQPRGLAEADDPGHVQRPRAQPLLLAAALVLRLQPEPRAPSPCARRARPCPFGSVHLVGGEAQEVHAPVAPRRPGSGRRPARRRVWKSDAALAAERARSRPPAGSCPPRCSRP